MVVISLLEYLTKVSAYFIRVTINMSKEESKARDNLIRTVNVGHKFNLWGLRLEETKRRNIRKKFQIY